MADATDILQILSVISAAFPNYQEQPQTPEVYLQLLGDMDTALLKVAVLQCCSEPGRKFAPTVGEIRGAAAELTRLANHVPSSYEAWQEVQQSFRGMGKPWSHPLVKQAVDIFGWHNLGMSENPVADRARFIEAYEQLLHQGEREQTMLPAVRRYIEENTPLRLDMGEAPALPTAGNDEAPAPEFVPAPDGVALKIRTVLARLKMERSK